MVSVENICFEYDTQQVFSDFSLRIKESEFFSIIGPNGSGKSTLLKLILGILKPTTGKIFIQGKDLSRIGRKKFSRIVSGVLQDFSPAYSFSVEEIIAMGRTPYSRLFSELTVQDHEFIDRAIEETGVEELREKSFEELSSGEKQRVLVAKCFAQNTPLLLLDECIAHLDAGHVQQIMEVVKRKNQKERITVVSVLHDINLASLYSDRIGVLDQGKLVLLGAPKQIIVDSLIKEVYHANATVLEHPTHLLPQVLLNKKETDDSVS